MQAHGSQGTGLSLWVLLASPHPHPAHRSDLGVGSFQAGPWDSGPHWAQNGLASPRLQPLRLLCSLCTGSSQVVCQPEEGELPSAAAPEPTGCLALGPWGCAPGGRLASTCGSLPPRAPLVCGSHHTLCLSGGRSLGPSCHTAPEWSGDGLPTEHWFVTARSWGTPCLSLIGTGRGLLFLMCVPWPAPAPQGRSSISPRMAPSATGRSVAPTARWRSTSISVCPPRHVHPPPCPPSRLLCSPQLLCSPPPPPPPPPTPR